MYPVCLADTNITVEKCANRLRKKDVPISLRRQTRDKNLLDGGHLAILRRTIINHHITEKAGPTMKTVYKKLVEDIDYQGSTETLHEDIHKIGFLWWNFKLDIPLLSTLCEMEEETASLSKTKRCLVAILCGRTSLFLLMMGYTLLGALMFKAIEGGDDSDIPADFQKSREECLKELWLITGELF
ncbi:hypothetical protein JTB14_036134 [Gonioctena quinquepunctata]|nr:hypothetical protein JTB14_036134 [Gonioctena quinquepunctata]